MAEQGVKEKKRIWQRIKDLHDIYKFVLLVLPIFGGAFYDRFVNMWGVTDKLEQYRQEFIQTRKEDIHRYQMDQLVDSMEKAELRKEIRELKRERLTSKSKSNERKS